MHQVVKQGTGGRADLGERQAAGKTCTTQGARDAWFIGFTADYVAGVWMGYDDNRKLTGVTGGGLPADIWRETMVRVHDGLPLAPLAMQVPQPITRHDETQGGTDSNAIEDAFKSLENELEQLGDEFKKDTKEAKSEIGNLFKKLFGKKN